MESKEEWIKPAMTILTAEVNEGLFFNGPYEHRNKSPKNNNCFGITPAPDVDLLSYLFRDFDVSIVGKEPFNLQNGIL